MIGNRHASNALIVLIGCLLSVFSFFLIEWVLKNREIISLTLQHGQTTTSSDTIALLIGGGIFVCLISIYLIVILVGRNAQVEKMVQVRTAELSRVNGELAEEVAKRKRFEQVKDEFISNVSHEIRTPLTLIKLSISNLQVGVEGNLNRRQLNLVEQTTRHINRLGRIIDDLLDLSRLESGKASLNRKQLNTAGLIQQIVQEASMTAKDKDLLFETAIHPDLPSIYADEDMVVQVFHNLLNNAYRFASTRFALKVVPFETEGQGGELQKCLQFTVTNDGPGIDPKDMKALFRKFEQINRPSGGSGYKGTGLGLAICREMISLHYGKIWAESFDGLTHFHFTLPQYDPTREFLTALEEGVDRATADPTQTFALAALSVDSISEIRSHGGEYAVARLFDQMEQVLKRETLRATDSLSRHVSRDHLVVLFDKASPMALEAIRERLVKLWKDSGVEIFGDLPVSNLLMGLAVYPENGHTPEELIQSALEHPRKA